MEAEFLSARRFVRPDCRPQKSYLVSWPANYDVRGYQADFFHLISLTVIPNEVRCEGLDRNVLLFASCSDTAPRIVSLLIDAVREFSYCASKISTFFTSLCCSANRFNFVLVKYQHRQLSGIAELGCCCNDAAMLAWISHDNMSSSNHVLLRHNWWDLSI